MTENPKCKKNKGLTNLAKGNIALFVLAGAYGTPFWGKERSWGRGGQRCRISYRLVSIVTTALSATIEPQSNPPL